MSKLISGAKALREFFEADGGRKLTFEELKSFKATDPDGYTETARLAALALGYDGLEVK